MPAKPATKAIVFVDAEFEEQDAPEAVPGMINIVLDSVEY